MELTNGESLAIRQLQEIQKYAGHYFELCDIIPGLSSGIISVKIDLCCHEIIVASGGLQLREREQFLIFIPKQFPYLKPSAFVTHDRFAGFPHVQWQRSLCLYQAPEAEWNPNDGMFGFIERLYLWLTKAAVNELDPIGGPLHPPIAYTMPKPVHSIIPKVNTPEVDGKPWLGFATLSQVNQYRSDIIGWQADIDKIVSESISSNEFYAPAILLSNPTSMEFPDSLCGLLALLFEEHLGLRLFLSFIRFSSTIIPNGIPLYFVIGTPMRNKSKGDGKPKQHIAVWFLESELANDLNLALNDLQENDEQNKIESILNWSTKVKVKWCRVLENRPEIVVRRDDSSPMSAFRNATCSVWGCGALGSQVAIYLAQAGVEKLYLYDNGIVKPGISIRQPYTDRDIGFNKSECLQKYINELFPLLTVEAVPKDILSELEQAPENIFRDTSFVFDCTASNVVQLKLESILCKSIYPHTFVSMVICHRAQHGIVVVKPSVCQGGVYHVFRKTKLALCSSDEWLDFVENFYGLNKSSYFQPEPGCSEPTFIGSGVDTSTLASMMINHAAASIKSNNACLESHVVSQPYLLSEKQGKSQRGFGSFDWKKDCRFVDEKYGYQIIISKDAISEVQNHINKSKNALGANIETGGILFGEISDVLKTVWIDVASGPPPDSQQTSSLFVCGKEGTFKQNQELIDSSFGSTSYIGTWHTHPNSVALPSPTDFSGMRNLLNWDVFSPSKALLVIIGTPHRVPEIKGYLFSREDFLSHTGDSQ